MIRKYVANPEQMGCVAEAHIGASEFPVQLGIIGRRNTLKRLLGWIESGLLLAIH
jgi:hypothetical protein